VTLKKRPLREDLVALACFEAYGAIRHEGRLSDRALEYVLRDKRHLYSTERRAVAERVYALLRRQRLVDYLAEKWPKFDTLPVTRQDVVRLAISRVLEGETPAEVVATMQLPDVEGRFFGAMLQRRDALKTRPLKERLAIECSLPDFFADKLFAQLGNEALEAGEAMNVRAQLTARVNLLKTTREELKRKLEDVGVKVTLTPLSPLGLFLDTRINVYSLEPFKEGLFEVQDEGSQLLGMLVDAPPRKVIDACAGAGGKTLQLAAQMKNRGDLHAFDVDERRLEDLRQRARRAGVHNARVLQIPPEGPEAEAALLPFQNLAERVLVDAPCSGSGTYRRKPDARYKLDEALLLDHVRRQQVLIERFATMVKPGGRLIYGTCSVLREENENVVEAFLAKHPEFTVAPATTWLGEELAAKTCVNGMLRLYPHRHRTDGFFGAVLVRAKQ
jgi:16S rRNA (cytosine967-C5)-methyltransferase